MDIRTGSISAEARAGGISPAAGRRPTTGSHVCGNPSPPSLASNSPAIPRILSGNWPAPNLHFPAIRKWENGVRANEIPSLPFSTSTFAKASSAKILSLPGKQLGRYDDVASSLSRKTTSDRFIMYYSASVGKTLALLHVSKIIFFGGPKAATESD